MSKAVFKPSTDEARATWTVETAGGRFTVSISELFPSGMYDVGEVRSEAFGISLVKRLEGNPEAVLKYLLSNRRTVNVADAMETIDEGKAVSIASEFVPLNDAEREFRDEMRRACRGG